MIHMPVVELSYERIIRGKKLYIYIHNKEIKEHQFGVYPSPKQQFPIVLAAKLANKQLPPCAFVQRSVYMGGCLPQSKDTLCRNVDIREHESENDTKT